MWQDGRVNSLVKVVKDWLIYIVYFGVMSVLLWKFRWELAWFWIGAGAGILVLGLDHLVYVVAYPFEPTSQRVIQLLKSRQFKEAYDLLKTTTEERTRLYFRQAIGQVVLILLGVYLLTSSAGLFGKGLILSANLGLLVQEWRGVTNDLRGLKSWLFQHVRGEVSDQTAKGYVFTVTIAFLVLSAIAIYY